MTEKLIIYVKDENQQKEIIRRHPEVEDADWIDLRGETSGMENILPMVCTKDDKGEEVCGGEEFITQLKRKK